MNIRELFTAYIEDPKADPLVTWKGKSRQFGRIGEGPGIARSSLLVTSALSAVHFVNKPVHVSYGKAEW